MYFVYVLYVELAEALRPWNRTEFRIGQMVLVLLGNVIYNLFTFFLRVLITLASFLPPIFTGRHNGGALITPNALTQER